MPFIKVAAACPKTKISEVSFNIKNIIFCIEEAYKNNSKIIVFPELCTTSYTCGDLFLQKKLIDNSNIALKKLCDFSTDKDIFISVGAPIFYNNQLFNCAVNIFKGEILGIVPKSFLPNYSEFYEKRWFTEGLDIKNLEVDLDFQENIPFGTDLIFTYKNIKLAFEICEDLWVTIPPSSYYSLYGANIICNLSASNELIGKYEYRKSLVSNQSARCMCAYIYSSSGVHESTTDLLFSGHLLISENGSILSENSRFNRENDIIYSIIDLEKLSLERLKNISFKNVKDNSNYRNIKFKFNHTELKNFDRYINKHPFIPKDLNLRDARCNEILNIQSSALAKRLEHTKTNKVVIGISGGLDSTLALLVAYKTFKLLNIPYKNIIAITMPGFGTTDRTYNNAIKLCKDLGTTLKEINIVAACLQHFKDIGHDESIHDVTYENVQARERTQILMDSANKEGAILIGTGDLSEIALGWSTYNGDHMSMYSVNCSIPKTLVKYLVYYAAYSEDFKCSKDTLIDILETPVSPELLPKDSNGEITQKTEDLVGPYELHDFFLYHLMKEGSTPERLFFLACHTFKDDYDKETIKKWLNKFLYRFFSQQFKRSAIPDGPKVGTISLSPRGDLRMPSDASPKDWVLE
ncbi:NAD(+) synthase [Hathewaya limosa]|uniref:NAD(+) synthase n=1 Tax=Hathewaya limosa TaxID=1536 RepID=UPI0027D8B1A0|nr:NAD(+) synthase [Hathewaya limosa]